MLPLSIILFLVLSIFSGWAVFGPALGGSFVIHALFIVAVIGFVASTILGVERIARVNLESQEAAKEEARLRAARRAAPRSPAHTNRVERYSTSDFRR